MRDKEFFRFLTINDAAAMSALERACFAQAWSEEACRGALAQKCFAAFGRWRDKKLLAYVSFYRVRDEIEIINIASAPEERRRGHAGGVLASLLQAASKMGMQKASLEVRKSNAPAIALYEKHGFNPCGTRKGYYPDNGEDALLYCRLFHP